MNIQRWAPIVRHFLALATLVCGGLGLAHAANPSMLNDFKFDQPAYVHKLPFAQQKLVLQVSSDDPALWNLVLNNAQNVLDYFGQEKVRIVVVAYGPGLKMFLKKSPVAARLAAQNDEGIEFDACHNTMKAMEKKTGHMPVLADSVVIVPAGVVRIMQLEKDGFVYIRP